MESEDEPTEKLGKIEFDSLNGVLRCGKLAHAFHSKSGSASWNLKLFRELWNSMNKALPQYTLAIRIELVESAKEFEQSKKMQQRFLNIVKSIKGILNEKGFPISIEQKKGILLKIEK